MDNPEGLMKKREDRSLRSRFTRFVLIIFILIFIIALYSNLQSFKFWQEYRRTFTQFDELSHFYAEVKLMNYSMKNYIYSHDPLDVEVFQNHYDAASISLDKLMDYEDEELQFRYGLLRNMIQTYKENEELYSQSSYDSQDRLAMLIDETYPQYALLVTNEMNLEKERMLESWKSQLLITLCILCLLILLTSVFVIQSLRSITSPIEKMIVNINRIKTGQFDIRNVQSDSREIRILLESFETMAEELQTHIEQIHEKSRIEKELIKQENENLRITSVLAETKLNALQGQMNPHFLFNTLSLISKMAYVEGAEKTSELMVKTASLLRYSLDMCGKTSSLDQEMVCVENYIQIQEPRVGDRILFITESCGNLKGIEIPGMVLQPLVENCVVHGVKDLIRDAEISVKITVSPSQINIQIQDNGPGFPQHILDGFSNDKDILQSSSIGLSNVRERLRIFYKNDFSMSLSNEGGSVIRIRLLENGRSLSNV
ncbi:MULTISPECIES: histidine kinase [unclassified Oceanispirochaeta]|nr:MULTISPECIES: histidine kinase [unclassified Oceanispirochaeta]MBF9017294.1 histidine kinase [Oceanispirochaeta sp. M2]NPD73804.1 histidine kinase [Oceanispirochaeta sp. M1]RDG30406.1 HAMP domain-containing protein [Oceanispirochaeta sp. M1]